MGLHPALAAGRVAVVSGAASGIGLAAARRFASLGMKVCLADLSAEALDRAAAEVAAAAPAGSPSVLAVPTDVSRLASVQALPQIVAEHPYNVSFIGNKEMQALFRPMALLRRCYAKLHLLVNESKSAVASVFGRKFLGYSLWIGGGREGKRKVADKALSTFKQRIRELTCRSGGRSMSEVVQRLRSYVLGWKGYFQLAQTPRVWRKLDEWLRHRLRAIQLKHWKRGPTMHRELLKLGAAPSVAKQVAANSRCWWRNSDNRVKTVLTIAHFDRLGVPRLS